MAKEMKPGASRQLSRMRKQKAKAAAGKKARSKQAAASLARKKAMGKPKPKAKPKAKPAIRSPLAVEAEMRKERIARGGSADGPLERSRARRAAAKKKASIPKPKSAVGKPLKKELKPKSAVGKPTKKKAGKSATPSFSSAFAAARKAGKKNFTWKGNSYHTRTKEESGPSNRTASGTGGQKRHKIAKPKNKMQTDYNRRQEARAKERKARDAKTRKQVAAAATKRAGRGR